MIQARLTGEASNIFQLLDVRVVTELLLFSESREAKSESVVYLEVEIKRKRQTSSKSPNWEAVYSGKNALRWGIMRVLDGLY